MKIQIKKPFKFNSPYGGGVILSLLLLIVLSALWVRSCNRIDTLTPINVTNDPSFKMNNYSGYIKTDIEEFTTTKVFPGFNFGQKSNKAGGKKILSSSDSLYLLPQAKRTITEIRINEAGEVEADIQNVKSIYDVKPVYNYKNDNSSTVVRTHIVNNISTSYNSEGKVISTNPVNFNAFYTGLMEKIKQDTMNMSSNNNNKSINGLSKFFVNSIDKGAKVMALGMGLFSINKKIGNNGKQSKSIMNEQGRMYSVASLNELGNIENVTFYAYSEEKGKIRVANTVNRAYKTTASGVLLEVQTISRYHHYETKFN